MLVYHLLALISDFSVLPILPVHCVCASHGPTIWLPFPQFPGSTDTGGGAKNLDSSIGAGCQVLDCSRADCWSCDVGGRASYLGSLDRASFQALDSSQACC